MLNRKFKRLFPVLSVLILLCFAVPADNMSKTAILVSPSTTSREIRKLSDDFVKLFNITPEIINIVDDKNLNFLTSFNIIFSNKEILTGDELNALCNYIENGGYLVAVGNFGKYLDVNKNNLIDENIDKINPPEASKLTGVSIQASKISIEKIRVLSDNPLLRNFHIDKWIDYPIYSNRASSMKIEENEVVPLAEAFYRPFGYKKTESVQKYLSSRTCSRHDVYICVKPLGKGLTVRIAEDVFSSSIDNPFFKTLVGNLLTPCSYAGFMSGIENYKDPRIIYEHGSLTPNPDFSDIYRCSIERNLKGNSATGEIMMPSDWQFNSWKGRYQAKVERIDCKYGEFALTVFSDDSDSRSGGSVWQAYCNNSMLEAGPGYKISLYAKGENITSAFFSIKVKDSDGKTYAYAGELPSGSFDWKDFTHSFVIPKSILLRKGFVAGVSFTGPGKLYVTRYVLKEEN